MVVSSLEPNPVSLRSGRCSTWLLLASPLPPSYSAITPHLVVGVWQEWHLLDCSLGTSHSHLEARNHWWLWHFLFIDMVGDIFISQSFTMITNLTIFVRHLMTFLFYFLSQGTGRLIPDQVLIDMSFEVLISRLGQLIIKDSLNPLASNLTGSRRYFPSCFFPYLESHCYNYSTLYMWSIFSRCLAIINLTGSLVIHHVIQKATIS